MLSPQLSSIADRRKDRLESVFATVERLDTVVTIREMLMSENLHILAKRVIEKRNEMAQANKI